MKIVISGGRNFTDYRFVEQNCNDILREYINKGEEIEIVSGRCSVGKFTYMTKNNISVYGVDGLAERYAEEMNFKFTPFPADWKKYSRASGPIRNKLMIDYAAPDGILIAFWDQKSKGTKSAINETRKQNLVIHIINY